MPTLTQCLERMTNRGHTHVRHVADGRHAVIADLLRGPADTVPGMGWHVRGREIRKGTHSTGVLFIVVPADDAMRWDRIAMEWVLRAPIPTGADYLTPAATDLICRTPPLVAAPPVTQTRRTVWDLLLSPEI